MPDIWRASTTDATGAARSAREWSWSSYQATGGLSAAPSWLEVGWLLSQFGRGRAQAQARYREFVSEGRGAGYRPWQGVVGQVVLGDETFRAAIALLAREAGGRRFSEIGAYLGVKAWLASHLASLARQRAARDREYQRRLDHLREGLVGADHR